MAITRSTVLNFLRREEPDFEQAARALGDDAIPHLKRLVEGPDTQLAAKAASLAGFFASDHAIEVISLAANDSRRNVRVSAAVALARHPRAPTDLFNRLLGDPEAGVRKWALKSLETAQPRGMKKQVQRVAESDSEPGLRELAKKIAQRLP